MQPTEIAQIASISVEEVLKIKAEIKQGERKVVLVMRKTLIIRTNFTKRFFIFFH